MRLYQLRSKQALPISMGDAWAFLSNPANLKLITPEHMGFHMVSPVDRPMYAGQIIQYKVSPFPGYKTKWVTEITHVKEGVYFVDEQRFGPYALWHHKHFLTEIKGGVEMEDIIDYKIPYGFLGRLAHPLIVKKRLLELFRYREGKLIDLFGTVENVPNEINLNSF